MLYCYSYSQSGEMEGRAVSSVSMFSCLKLYENVKRCNHQFTSCHHRNGCQRKNYQINHREQYLQSLSPLFLLPIVQEHNNWSQIIAKTSSWPVLQWDGERFQCLRLSAFLFVCMLFTQCYWVGELINNEVSVSQTIFYVALIKKPWPCIKCFGISTDSQQLSIAHPWTVIGSN